MDRQILNDQIAGLRSRITTLRADRDLFVKDSALAEQIETARSDLRAAEAKLEAAKTVKAEIQGRKAALLAELADRFTAVITDLLPEGEAVFRIEDDRVNIGWRRGEQTTPLAGLSGGQRAFFEAALSYALLGDSPMKIIVVEAAELDDARLIETLAHLAKSDAQYIVNTCHEPFQPLPEGWGLLRFQ